jgi:16S rRNA processing protein RimM
MTAAEPWVWLARIRRPQGRKGEVFADLLTDFPEKFAERKRLWLVPEKVADQADAPAREMELTDHWLHKGGIVLHFAGVDSIATAEALADQMVVIPQSERTKLDDDEVYIADLIGCALVDVASGSPVVVGTIAEVDRSTGPVALLVVEGAAGEILVPFAKSFLRQIDLEGKKVEMALPAGLVELNNRSTKVLTVTPQDK